MGIPKFFRWLTRRYPLILQNVQKEEDCPPIDNLYLDLNGIVHNCIHGNDPSKHEKVSKMEDFDEVWVSIMRAIDEIVHSVKPKKLLFLAVDGVAPRAKMNQQRARRFRSAKEAFESREQLRQEGKEAPELFDTNAISPGTQFMFELCKQLHFFVQYKTNVDPLYQNLAQVIVSDGSIPGEGEHKMMDFIRQAKQSPQYDPNTRHCFYGADADLIMLSLLTHEPHFIIIREEHIFKKSKQGGVQRIDKKKQVNFQIVYINLLREYFELEYKPLQSQMKIQFDLERIIDDFVFFCFFIGNDFLPSLSALDISEGSLDQLIKLYRKLLPQMDNYITESGTIYWDRAQPFIKMLGEHEHESFIERVNQMRQRGGGRGGEQSIVSSSVREVQTTQTFIGKDGKIDRKREIQRLIQVKIQDKKRMKIVSMIEKKKDKSYKKYITIKKYQEDKDQDEIEKLKVLEKYQRKLWEQNNGSEEDKEEFQFDRDQDIIQLLNLIKDDSFSELDPNDILTDDISDVDESQINLQQLDEKIQKQNAQINKAPQQDLIEKYMEMNMEFMKKFIKLYKIDPFSAKAIGAQHWRWYYPYHYAPMISDIDEDIVENYLKGSKVIGDFEIDENCSHINEPYRPFFQLLCILPAKSVKLLPQQYSEIILGVLRKYFPDDFTIDLNGRSLPWEAVCLIPFVEESLFIELEQQLLLRLPLSDYENVRNSTKFEYVGYLYELQEEQAILESSLQKFESIKNNLKTTIFQEYKNVGKHSFTPQLHPNIVLPCPSFPSFKWLNVQRLEFESVHIQQVAFKRALVVIPSSEYEQSTDDLKYFAEQFKDKDNIKIYVGFPYQHEAIPQSFEDDYSIFTLFEDIHNPNQSLKIISQQQNLEGQRLERFVNRQVEKLRYEGIFVENPYAFVTLQRVSGTAYDKKSKKFYKTYSDNTETIPLSMIMAKRTQDHYLSLETRCKSIIESINPGQEVICLNQHMLGIMGRVVHLDFKRNAVKVEFDKESEQSKLHDPFIGQVCLKDENFVKKDQIKRFYNEKQIEEKLKLKPGVINRITSSFLLSYHDPNKEDRQVIDIGLNIKNYTKKVHIPSYVRYVILENDKYRENDQKYQLMDSNIYSNQPEKKHRRYWEFSQECVNILQDYKNKYPEIFELIYESISQDKQVLPIKECFPQMKLKEATEYVSGIAKWIVSLPTSKLPYVEIGYDALHQNLIQRIQSYQEVLKQDGKQIKIKCKKFEYLPVSMLLFENFPIYTNHFSPKEVNDFNIGDRVMNINSTLREYVPFGHRGTVVGKTSDKLIVLFDQQYLGGDNINGQSQDFRGGKVGPNDLLNLTQKFMSILKKNKDIVSQFQEIPMTESEFNQILKDQKFKKQKSNQHDQKGYSQKHHNQRETRTYSADDTFQEESKEKFQNQISSHRKVIHIEYEESKVQIEKVKSKDDTKLYVKKEKSVKQTESYQDDDIFKVISTSSKTKSKETVVEKKWVVKQKKEQEDI
eukprot:403367227